MNRQIKNDQLETIYKNLNQGIENGVLHLNAENISTFGNSMEINGKKLINFSSYSYLGLERNDDIVSSCIEATKTYGTQFGYSRAFVSIKLYDELEKLLSEIFSGNVVLAPSTTLAHQSAMPVLMDKSDLIIMDQFAHASMYYSAKAIRDTGADLEIVRHNNINNLKERIIEMSSNYRKVWYVADGVYSMQGDYSPVKELESLMDEFPNFHLYIDDAHGMSWCGKNGKGYVLNKIELHKQMVLITSLNKAFASSGGVIVVKSKEAQRKIRTCGGTLIFSTPIQPPMLGAGIASAKIHLTDEILSLQNKLGKKIKFCNQIIKEIGLPEISASDSPVFFLPTAFPKVSYSIVNKMMGDGIYVTPVLFPAVSTRRAGIRFCLNVNHSENAIRDMLYKMKRHFLQSLVKEKISVETVVKYFKIEVPTELFASKKTPINMSDTLNITVYKSISELDQKEWNNNLGQLGMFDSNSLRFLEKSFRNNSRKEDNWEFYYLIIRQSNKPVLMTFFTKCWVKDDIFKSDIISKDVESKRLTDPYFLTTESLMMGSLITEGNHLFLDRDSENWQMAVNDMLNWADEFQHNHGINAVYLRDFDYFDFDLSDKFIAHGFVETDLPDYTHILNMSKFNRIEDWWNALGSKKRQRVKSDVLNLSHKYEISIMNEVSEPELNYFFELYLNVKSKSFTINTFELPFKFFQNLNQDSQWEMITLKLKNNGLICAVVFSFKSEENYIPLVMGIDYDFLKSHNVYKQALYQTVQRGHELGKKNIMLGITSSLNKRRLGAIAVKKKIFVSMQDMYNTNVLSISKIFR